MILLCSSDDDYFRDLAFLSATSLLYVLLTAYTFVELVLYLSYSCVVVNL